ncbi:hypothetical protein HK102_010549, partial [Quaeritorhiza haematococci]
MANAATAVVTTGPTTANGPVVASADTKKRIYKLLFESSSGLTTGPVDSPAAPILEAFRARKQPAAQAAAGESGRDVGGPDNLLPSLISSAKTPSDTQDFWKGAMQTLISRFCPYAP